VTVAENEAPTQPYWLEATRSGDLYTWRNVDRQILPFEPPRISAEVTIEINGVDVIFSQPVEYRFADDIRGEIRRPLTVVPPFSVDLDEDQLLIKPSGRAQTKRLTMSITNHSARTLIGHASLNFRQTVGWKYTTSTPTFRLPKNGDKATIVFDVSVPPHVQPGKYEIIAQAAVGEIKTSSQVNLVTYPHIQTHRFYTEAVANALVLDLQTIPLRIGYIAGTGDKVAEAIGRMGLTVSIIDERELASGDLAKYEVIVVGIRASEVRKDFIANNQRLLSWVEDGGTLIVQYQRPVYLEQALAPFPAQMGPRVADENAPVKILQPSHPIFNFPNRITVEDFKGWVQERNLYNFSTMDPKYLPLLESHDAGEPENKGGLVLADVGKGKYVYCSYSLFRQLPAGVPGAYRLFANILSFAKARRAKSGAFTR
ncbi:MAG: hypothetical protein LC730_01020, partial [Acidobacteria bacterium]|nr:hypothetical protein [Acidobacteriota bacterium]